MSLQYYVKIKMIQFVKPFYIDTLPNSKKLIRDIKISSQQVKINSVHFRIIINTSIVLIFTFYFQKSSWIYSFMSRCFSFTFIVTLIIKLSTENDQCSKISYYCIYWQIVIIIWPQNISTEAMKLYFFSNNDRNLWRFN